MMGVVIVAVALAATASAAPAARIAERATTPTVYLAGDSTMALGGGGTGTQGWGEYLKYSLTIPVINKAIAGRSARSYTVEDHFAALAALVQPEDFVVIEFGHNDGGSLTPTDNGKSDCAGAGDEVCNTDIQHGILTYPAYLIAATQNFTSRGARVIIASPTPDNPWETGSFVYEASRFTAYANASAAGFAHAKFVDHGQLVGDEFRKLGGSVVEGFYPNDHTHTSPAGAAIVAQTFVRGVVCSDSFLKRHVKNETSAIVGSCL
ncbi:hypothetical protein LTR36_000849 [Oleoguttula mirabilis]|uniref:SGNH hydrolase-type esterase domain-containing protein n=1 Tax=Oleoguttula mirabilis TaxID=1507867 RepID=A0AAV9J3J7_9PEZI|nr:hypothetical protein LTR36_000849 [Oleoguttula mirabilis]